MAGAEILRQYLSASFVREAESPRQLFFFGVIYKDSRGFFLNRGSLPFLDLKRNRKFWLLIGIYILTLSLRFSPAFAEVDFIYSAFFSLIITLWVYCGVYKSLNWVLLLQVLGTSVAFATIDEANTVGFLFWLVLSVWAQLQLHAWQLFEESRGNADESNLLTSAGKIFKAVALAIILISCFRTADILIPEYNENTKPAEVTDKATSNFSDNLATKVKKPIVPKKFIQKTAELKLKAGSIDFSKLNVKDIKLPSAGSGESPIKPPSSNYSYGENRQALEEIRNNLDGKNPVSPEDFEKLRELSKKIKSAPDSGGDGMESSGADGSVGQTTTDSSDKIIEDRIENLKGFSKNQKQDEDDAAAYVRSRKELASQVDKLMEQDQKNTLLKEELNLQRIVEKLYVFLKRFLLLIVFVVLMTWWLSKKTALSHLEVGEEKSFSLPKEVRIRLKNLYKMLLKGNFSPKDEVLKSYYIVELAFKEFEFARDEDVPPLVFLEKLKSELPFVSKAAETPIDLFCRVFYGDKTPDDAEIVELRSSMHQLMKKLLVI